jgi:hypothetical protein
MKKEGTGNREQGTEIGAMGMRNLLRASVARVEEEAGPEKDLWPAMLRRIQEQPAHTPITVRAIPWFDWALAGGLLLLAAVSPGLVPVLLYYL